VSGPSCGISAKIEHGQSGRQRNVLSKNSACFFHPVEVGVNAPVPSSLGAVCCFPCGKAAFSLC
jgi:hypothetical protein